MPRCFTFLCSFDFSDFLSAISSSRTTTLYKDWKEDLFLELLNQSSLFCSCGAASTHSKNYHLARQLTLHMTKPCSKHMSASVTSDLSSEETAPLFMQVSRVYASQHKSCSVGCICTYLHIGTCNCSFDFSDVSSATFSCRPTTSQISLNY